jgi:hypothetical protein
MAVGDGPRLSSEAYDRINATLVLEGSMLSTGKPVGKPALHSDPALLAALDGAKPAPGCNLEAASLVTDEDGDIALKVSGWVSELGATITGPVGEIRLKGAAGDAAGQMRVDLARPDVAAFFKTPTGAKSGFSTTLKIGKLAAGAYVPMAYRRSVDGWFVCKGPQTLNVP